MDTVVLLKLFLVHAKPGLKADIIAGFWIALFHSENTTDTFVSMPHFPKKIFPV